MMNKLVAKIITGTVLVGTVIIGVMVAPKVVKADEYVPVKGISVSQTSVNFKNEGTKEK